MAVCLVTSIPVIVRVKSEGVKSVSEWAKNTRLSIVMHWKLLRTFDSGTDDINDIAHSF